MRKKDWILWDALGCRNSKKSSRVDAGDVTGKTWVLYFLTVSAIDLIFRKHREFGM